MNVTSPRHIGHFRVEEMLGRGGMGAVYQAYNTRDRRYVALKILPEDSAGDPERRQRFRREADLLRQVDNPHVVPIYDFGEVDGRLYLEMELIQGEHLGEVIARGPLPAARAVAITEQIAEALAAVHAKHLVHRDVKPANVLLTQASAGGTEHAYLVDFGIARSTIDSTRLTATGMIMGTLSYLAPEVIHGETATARSDVYALGCVLFECLTGTRPFAGTDVAVVQGHLHHPPPRPSTRGQDLPGAIDDVVLRALAKNPESRTTSTLSLASSARAAITTDRRPTRSGIPVWRQPESPQPSTDDLMIRTIPVQVDAADLPARPVPEKVPVLRPTRPVTAVSAHPLGASSRPGAGVHPPPGPPAPATRLGMPPEVFPTPVRLPPPPRTSARAKERRFMTIFTMVAVALAVGLLALAATLWSGAL